MLTFQPISGKIKIGSERPYPRLAQVAAIATNHVLSALPPDWLIGLLHHL